MPRTAPLRWSLPLLLTTACSSVGGSPAGSANPGPAVAIPAQWYGAQCLLDRPLFLLVGDAATWQARIVAWMFGGPAQAPDLGPFDWDRQQVLVIAYGGSSNGRSASAYDLGDTVLVQLDEHTYQSTGGTRRAPTSTPWGIFVLPRRGPRDRIVVQEDDQNLLGAPPRWAELCRFEGPGPPVTRRHRTRGD